MLYLTSWIDRPVNENHRGEPPDDRDVYYDAVAEEEEAQKRAEGALKAIDKIVEGLNDLQKDQYGEGFLNDFIMDPAYGKVAGLFDIFEDLKDEIEVYHRENCKDTIEYEPPEDD